MTTEIVLVVGLLAAMWLSTRMPTYQPTLAERVAVLARDLADMANASARTGDAMLSTADAVDALRRALTGPVEPIRTYDTEGTS